MTTRSPLPALVGLTLVFGACSSDMTEPNQAALTPKIPELAVTGNTWITRANMPANRTDPAVVTMSAAGQSIVYAIGGRNPNGVPVATVTAYNVATNTWTFRRQLPWPVAGSNGAGVINGKIYVSGGYSDYAGDFPWGILLMYDPATNTWTRKSDIPVVTSGDLDRVGAGGGVTGVINGKLYVVSGCFTAWEPKGYYESCNPLFFRYNPVTDRWVKLPAPFAGASTFASHVGGVIGGKFYVMGWSPYTQYDPHFAVYDPSTNRWTTRTPLGRSRPGAASAVLGGKLHVMGGTRYNAQTDAMDVLNINVVYDPATDAWTTRAPLPSPRSWTAATKVFLNAQPRIEVVGGIAPGNNVQYLP